MTFCQDSGGAMLGKRKFELQVWMTSAAEEVEAPIETVPQPREGASCPS
jgi:hypothetical protein